MSSNNEANQAVKMHMQEINEAMKNNNKEKMERHYTAILRIYGLL